MSFRWSLTWLVSAATAGGLVMLGASAGASAATVGRSPAGVAPQAVAALAGKPAVEICGHGPAVKRPASMILTCADDGELAEHLTWRSWSATRATASGIVAWRTGAADFAKSTRWDRTRADVVLTDPVAEPGHRVLFTQLELHVTGSTPKGFMRDLRFDEAPATAPASRASAAQPRPAVSPAAASGSLGYADIEGFWIDAGGPTNSTGGYTDPQIAAAITGAESSFLPGNIQQGVDYCGSGADKAGWGLWQLTCGNSVPQFGTDFQLLDPWNNAEAAVSKCEADVGVGDNCFDPWTTYATGAYENFLQSTAPDTQLTDPGEYVQYAPTPPNTPSSPGADPGSTYGPPMPGSSTPPPKSAPSPLSEDTAGQLVAFVNSGGQLVNDYYVSGWQGPGVLPGTPRTDSPIVVSPDGDAVYFIESNGDVANDYHTSSGWAGPGLTGGTAGAGSALAFTPGSSSAGTDPAVAFVNSSGALVNDYDTSSGWQGPGPLPGTPRAGSPLSWNAAGSGVFFIESNGDVANDYHTSSGWAGPGLTGGTAAPASSLAYAPGNGTTSGANVVFVETNGVLGNDWYANGWQGPGPLPGTPK